MKKVFSFALFSMMIASLWAQDWAMLSRYREENEKLVAQATHQTRVVFMGNSITEFWSKHYPEFFAGKPYINKGISGQTTPQMLVRFRQDVIDLNPFAVVILAGTNDIAENTGPSTLPEIAGNIFSMAELARAHGIEVLICSVLPTADYPWRPGLKPADKIFRLNEMLKDYAMKNQITWVDFYAVMNDGSGGLQPQYTYDGVHPNRKGYEVMSDIVEKSLQKLLKND